MQGKKDYQEKLFIRFQLSDYVPQDNFYRQLKSILDFNFLYTSTAGYYGTEGQKSIDPVVFMKLRLVGYLENLNSDRRIKGLVSGKRQAIDSVFVKANAAMSSIVSREILEDATTYSRNWNPIAMNRILQLLKITVKRSSIKKAAGRG